jgi:hypothetical protein
VDDGASDGPGSGRRQRADTPPPDESRVSDAGVVLLAAPGRRRAVASLLGAAVDACDALGGWYEAVIVDVDAANSRVFVHFTHWSMRHDIWLDVNSEKLQVLGTKTCSSPRLLARARARVRALGRIAPR